MDQKHRNLINTNFVQLSNSLATAIDEVCIQLWCEQIISDVMKQKILVKSGPRKKADALLDLIVTRGPHAFEALYKSALDAGLFDAADILHPDLKPHETTVNNTY